MADRPRRFYVASSWRNDQQPEIVDMLRHAGHDVYDFRNPEPGNTGFHWSEIDPDWRLWTPISFLDALDKPVAREGFTLDFDAMRWCDACLLLLPSGRSAHLEAGWSLGAGKAVAVLCHYCLDPDEFEPELMYLMIPNRLLTTADVVEWARHVPILPTPEVSP